MDKAVIKTLHDQSPAFALDPSVEALTNSSTLSSAALRFLGTLMLHYLPKTLIEYGSGVSTTFLSSVLTDKACQIYSIDHSEHYLGKTKKQTKKRENVTFFHCPIEPYTFRFKEFATYDASYIRALPPGTTFDFVLIDGPLGFRFGREAMLYQIASYLRPNTLIFLDDANRAPEREAIANWTRVWKHQIDVLHFTDLKKGAALVQLKRPSTMRWFPFGLQEIQRSRKMARTAFKYEQERLASHED